VSYEPGTEPDDTIGSALNCWRGWGFKLEHLDKAVAESVVADFKTLTAALCNNDLEDAHKLTQAIAHSIQRPQIKIRRGLLFANPTEGVGKTMFVEFICALHGTDNCAMVDATAFGKFLDWARCKTVIACEELFNDPKEAAGIAAILKILVSNDLLDSAGKYEKRLSFPNMALVFVLSNKLDAIHFKDEDRRWDVRSPHTVLSKAFYARMATYKASPSALAAVAQYLSTYDLTGFDPNERAVMTEAKTAMVEAGRSDLETFIRGVMENEDGGKELWTAEDLQVAYNHLLTTIQREQVTIHRVRMLATSMSIPKRRPNLPVDASGKRGKGPTLYLMRNAEAWQNATEEAVLNAYKPPCKLGQTPEKDPGLPKNVH
jgi:hypothetical protein